MRHRPMEVTRSLGLSQQGSTPVHTTAAGLVTLRSPGTQPMVKVTDLIKVKVTDLLTCQGH